MNTDTNTPRPAADNRAWKRALCYAGATVAGPVVAAVVAPAVGVVLVPLAVALPFFTMTLLEADVAHGAAA